MALALVLPCWTLLGMLDRAIELTIAHVSLRKQFGQPLSTFQGVQFQLTDAEVERSGLEILAKYALWSIGSGKPEALDDALALRMSAIEAAEVVFRVCHQLHGAVGFCDETTLSWLSRYSQPLRRLPLGLSATRDELTRRAGRCRPDGVVRSDADPTISTSSAPTSAPGVQEHIPPDWRATQTGVERRRIRPIPEVRGSPSCTPPGFAVPHWPREWGGGMSVAEQIVLYSELAAHDAPRLVLAFVGIHHAASTLLVAGTDEQRARHLPAILDGEIWVQGFSEPEAGSDLASLRTTARRDGDGYVVNGQKLWASGGKHADWCLLLARTDPEAPKRKGISYFLLDMTHAGRRGAADPQRDRRFALLRDLPQRRRDPRRQPGGRGERRMAGGSGDSGRRARHDDAGARRASRQRGLPLAGADRARPTIPLSPTGWRSSRSRSPDCAGCAASSWRMPRPAPRVPPTPRSSSCTTARSCSE